MWQIRHGDGLEEIIDRSRPTSPAVGLWRRRDPARACDLDRLGDAVVNGLAVATDEVPGKAESGFQCRGGIAERALDAVPERQLFVHQRQHTDAEKKLADGLAATQACPQAEVQKKNQARSGCGMDRMAPRLDPRQSDARAPKVARPVWRAGPQSENRTSMRRLVSGAVPATHLQASASARTRGCEENALLKWDVQMGCSNGTC